MKIPLARFTTCLLCGTLCLDTGDQFLDRGWPHATPERPCTPTLHATPEQEPRP